MGGVGKSTTINEVYHQVKKQCIFDEIAKVEVKVKPEIKRIQEEIAFALGLKFENEALAVRAGKLRERLLKIDSNQKKKTVLIILDDLWEVVDLREVGIPSGGNDQVQIKLLLTSRNEYLLSDKMGARHLIHLDVLSDADALKMFKIFVGVGAEGVKDDKVTEIARKCGGLPIVIEATAKALKDMAMDEWEKILERLDNDDVLEKLKVSYDYLRSIESKKLFLICGVVQGPRIQVRDLFKYTIGLRLYNQKDSSTLAAAAAELDKLLSGLEAASMLLKSYDSQYVKIHDCMRELAVKIVEEELPEGACFKRYNAELRYSFLKDMRKLNLLELTNVRVALSLPSSTTKLQLHHMKNLGTLCLHNCWFMNDISMIGELKGLQILSFRGSGFDKLPTELRELTALKMLDLSNCNKLTRIEPNVLGSFTELEELNMENSFNNWESCREDDVPPGNARLTELKNMSRLSNVRIHIPYSCTLPKNGQLFSSKLTMYQIMFGVAQKSNRRRSKDLDLLDYSLTFKFSYEDGLDSSEDSDCYHKLSKEYNKFSRVLMLTLDSPNIIWQDWIQTALQTTEVLYLSGHFDKKCKSMDEICIKGFECLKHLRMRNCPSFQFITYSTGDSFINLEFLFLEDMDNLLKVCGRLPRHEKAFNKLRVMEVDNCNKLTHLFNFSLLKSHLSAQQLEEITVKYCDELRCIVVSGEGDNYDDDVVTLSKLQKLRFKCLRKFSNFCDSPSKVLLSGKKVEFPCLESLIIENLEQLEHIWHPTDPLAVLGNLRLLKVESCDKLVRAINSNVLIRLQRDLESLSIKKCGLMKEVFDVDEGIIVSDCTDDEQHLVLFSKLKILSVEDMGGLEVIHNYSKNAMMMMGGRSMRIFPNIEWLDVSECPRLRYGLCCSLPTTAGFDFENLKSISIKSCDKMEAVVEVISLRMVDQQTHQDDTLFTNRACSIAEQVLFPRLKELLLSMNKSLKGIFISHHLSGGRVDDTLLLMMMFPDIESVNVWSCPCLRYVLSWSSLPLRVESVFVHLSKISISNCEGMEALVMMSETVRDQPVATATATRNDGHHQNNYDSAVSYSYSSLKEISINDCPQLKTFCQYLSSQQNSASAVDDLPFFSQKETFPCLESLCFQRLSKMGEIWLREVPPQNSFKLLKDVDISDCPELSVLFPSTIMPRLDNLTKLTVECCDGLEYLLSSLGGTSFVQLASLVIRNCRNIKEIVAAVEEETAGAAINENEDGMIRGGDHIRDIRFSHLRKLELKNLPRLEKFYSINNMTTFSDCPTDNLSFFSQKETFPCLESLDFEGLSMLGEIWPHEVPSDQTSFNMLKHVTINECPELSMVFPSTLIAHLENLTNVKVYRCYQLMQIVHGGGGSSNSKVDEEESMKMMFTFPQLRNLDLWDLPKIDRFYSSSSPSASEYGFQFPSLETLEIGRCTGVKTLFIHNSSMDMAGALFRSCDKQLTIPNLKSIDLYGLEDLTKIWNGEKAEGLFLKVESLKLWKCSSSCTNLQSVISVGVAASLSCWNVLTKLTLEYCDGLEYLLTPLGATSLVCLTGLYIENCKSIKEVFVAVDEEEEAAAAASNEENQGGIIIRRDGENNMIIFRNLKVLVLENLPRLERFSSVNNMVLNFPSLEDLSIRRCPNMTTFSSGTATTSTTKFGDLNSFVQKSYIKNSNN